MISPKVVKEVVLRSFGYVDIIPATGKPVPTRRYRTHLGVPLTSADVGIQWITSRKFEVCELPFQPHNFDVLLGMDFLEHYILTLQGGSFTLNSKYIHSPP